MFPDIEVIQSSSETQPRTHPRGLTLHSLEGTIQRVDYQARELRVIAEGRLWEFALSERCRLWFNGSLAPFRCFQPLDHIRLYYAEDGSMLIAEALYLFLG